MFSNIFLISIPGIGSIPGISSVTALLTQVLIYAIILLLISALAAGLLSLLSDSDKAFKYLFLVIFLILALVQLSGFNLVGSILALFPGA